MGRLQKSGKVHHAGGWTPSPGGIVIVYLYIIMFYFVL